MLEGNSHRQNVRWEETKRVINKQERERERQVVWGNLHACVQLQYRKGARKVLNTNAMAQPQAGSELHPGEEVSETPESK